MRWRKAGVKAAAQIALTSQVMACSSGARQSSRLPGSGLAAYWAVAASPRRAAAISAASRASVGSSIAASQAGSSSSVNSSWNSVARSSVSGVVGSRRKARRSPISPHRSRWAVKPKSANSAARSVSRQKRPSSATMRRRGSSLRSSTLSRWRMRSTGIGVSPDRLSTGPWRSHSASRTSHRCRAGRGALGSAALSSAVRSQAAPVRGRAADAVVNAAWPCRPARTRPPAIRTSARRR